MHIVLNHEPVFFAEPQLTIQEILDRQNFTFKLLVVKLNGETIRKDLRATTVVQEGDRLEVIHLMSGG